ncbi:MAG: PQQ-binding-like beta-propeller repeat protein [Planctomycetes bacterium]|nr:PQQ-binding-like beta-propeller repeat protein [Planctomycetota bacterium]
MRKAVFIYIFIIIAAVNLSLSAETIEVVYRWQEVLNQVDSVVLDRFTKTMAPAEAYYYYIMYAWAKDDVSISKTPSRVNQAWIPEKILLDGKEITYEKYTNLIEFSPPEKYEIVYYQKTPEGLLKIGTKLAGSSAEFVSDIQMVTKVASQIGEKTELGLWHFGGLAVVVGSIINFNQKESEVPELPPVAILTAIPVTGTVSTAFYLDGSASYDLHETASALMVRWDYTNDGVWDTAYSKIKTSSYTYPGVGTYTVKMELADNQGFTASATADVNVIADGSALLNSPSPMFHHDLRHTGLSPYQGPITNTFKWAFSTGGDVESSPAIDAANNIYIASYDGNLYKITPSSSTVWAGPYVIGGLVHSSPAIAADGTIFIGAASGMLHAINPGGTQKWTYDTGSWLKSSPAIGADGTVYVGSINGNLYAINYDGSFKWSRQCGPWLETSPAIAADGTIYVGSADGRVYAVNPDSTIKWSYPTGSGIVSSPAIAADGTVYIGSLDNYLYALNADGTLKWRYQTNGAVYSSPAVDAGGNIYFGSDDDKLYCLDPTGAIVAGFPFVTGNNIRSSPTIDSTGAVYIGSDDGKLYSISPTGIANWDYNTGQPIRSTPALANSSAISPVVYVGANDDKLYAIGQAPPDPADISLTKKANKQQVTIGDIVTYQINITNKGPDPTDATRTTTVYDRIPFGFKYVRGSTLLNGVKQADPTGAATLAFDAGDFIVGESKILTYQLVVGSGVTFGKYENKAYAVYYYNVPPVTEGRSNTARESVTVIPDPIFDLGTIIGKVFEDANNNGVQDEGEKGIAKAKIIMEDGTIITTDKDGKYHVPGVMPGTHLLSLKVQGFNSSKVVRVTEGLLCKVNFPVNSKNSTNSTDSLDLVILGEGVAGYNNTSGNINPVKHNDMYNDGAYGQGRVAGYLKTTINGKYRITSSVDTDRIANRENERSLSRYIDPDKYYLTYGDTSKVSWDATNTQGPVYLLAEHLPSGSNLVVGNYQTGLNKTELLNYNRTLYGAKVYVNKTNNDQKTMTNATLFGAQAKQLSGHNEFKATGGTFYYLENRNVVRGSEQIRIEVRDKITNLTLSNTPLSQGDDYEIDYSNGRIVLTKPVASVESSNGLISTGLLNGNPAYIIIDYEYEPDRSHWTRGSYGGSASRQIPIPGEQFQVKLGGTYIREETLDENYELRGANTSLTLFTKNKLDIEYAESVSFAIPNSLSTDGGLSFSNIPNAVQPKGAAYSIKTTINEIDRLPISAYYKRLQPDFISSDTVNQQGTEKYGLSVSNSMLEGKLNLIARYDAQELLELDTENLATRFQVGAKRTETASLHGNYTPNNQWAFNGEYRHQEAHIPLNAIQGETNRDTDIVAARVERKFYGGVFRTYLGQQATLNGDSNYQTTLGAAASIVDPDTMDIVSTARVEATSGTDGNAQLVGVETKLNELWSLYTNYRQGLTRTEGRESLFTTGTAYKPDESTRVYTQQEYKKSEISEANSQRVGVDKQINVYWRWNGNFEKSRLQNYDTSETERYSASTAIGYYSKPLVITTRLEVRFDENTMVGDRNQYLTSNSFKWNMERNLYIDGRFNWAQTLNQATETTEALYREYGLGVGYRPVNWDRLNILAKYTRLTDDYPASQADLLNAIRITRQRLNIYSIELAYDVTKKLEVIEKYALKEGEEKVVNYPWMDSKTTLHLTRFNYKIFDKWTAGLEYRTLRQYLADDTKSGFLAEVLYKLADSFYIGGGYNFTDFSDDLTINNDYSLKGAFVRFVVAFSK